MPDLRRLDFERGTKPMLINGQWRPAYEWCEMFGHEPDLIDARCLRCGGAEISTATTRDSVALPTLPVGVPGGST